MLRNKINFKGREIGEFCRFTQSKPKISVRFFPGKMYTDGFTRNFMFVELKKKKLYSTFSCGKLPSSERDPSAALSRVTL